MSTIHSTQCSPESFFCIFWNILEIVRTNTNIYFNFKTTTIHFNMKVHEKYFLNHLPTIILIKKKHTVALLSRCNVHRKWWLNCKNSGNRFRLRTMYLFIKYPSFFVLV